MGFSDQPEPKAEHVEKPFKEVEKTFKEKGEKLEHKEQKDKEKEKDKEGKEHKEAIKAEHKDFKEFKEAIKAEFKDHVKVEIKEQVEKLSIKEKDKDKEVLEGGGFEQPGGDPAALLHSLHARVSSIEEQLGIGAEAFVAPEERPPVGGSVAKQAEERPGKAAKASKASKAE